MLRVLALERDVRLGGGASFGAFRGAIDFRFDRCGMGRHNSVCLS